MLGIVTVHAGHAQLTSQAIREVRHVWQEVHQDRASESSSAMSYEGEAVWLFDLWQEIF